MTQVVWVHSGGWLTQAAISYVGVHNAWSFAQAGAKSHLLMPARRADAPIEEGLRHHYGLDPHPQLDIHRITAERKWWHWHHPFYGQAFGYVEELRRRSVPPEPIVVLTREQRFLPYLARLARLPNTVALFEPHYFFVDQTWRGTDISLGDRRRGDLERRYLPLVHGLTCITGEQDRLYRQAMPALPTVSVPLGVKTLPATQQCTPDWRDRRALGYIGHLHGYKGIDALVGFDRQLREAGVRVELFGGSEAEIAAYRRQCGERGVSSLNWHPFVPPAQVFPALAETVSVGIVALEDTYYNRNLTCPVKALDFLALGLPVVASDLPSTRGVLGEAGIYYTPGRMDEMLAAVIKLLEDASAYDRACRAARSQARALDWVERARRILDFSEALMGDG